MKCCMVDGVYNYIFSQRGTYDTLIRIIGYEEVYKYSRLVHQSRTPAFETGVQPRILYTSECPLMRLRRGEWETISPTSGGFVADGSKLDNACENVAKEELNVLILKA